MKQDNLSGLMGALPPEKREAVIRAANAFMASEDGKKVMRAAERDPSLQKKLKEAEAKGIARLSKKDRDRLLEALGQSDAVRRALEKKEGKGK